MSYQPYMNMGFGPGGAGHPYMMGFQGGMPVQMTNPSQYIASQRTSSGTVTVPNRPPPTKSGKRKMNNDPNRPKRPTSAYFFFVQVEREEAAKRGEKITRVAEWTKQISVKWRELTVEQKEVFQKMAATDKARYTQQMQIYTGKDANRPKRPQSAYFLWLADFRARMKDKFIENKDILRAAGEEWRKLTMMAKAPYEQLAEEERRKYEVRMKEYNLSGGAKRPRLDAVPTIDVKPKQLTSNSSSSPYPLPSSQPPPQQQALSLTMQPDQKQRQQQQQQQQPQVYDDNSGDDDDDGVDDDDDGGDYDDDGVYE